MNLRARNHIRNPRFLIRVAILVLAAGLLLPQAVAAYQLRAALRDLEQYHPESGRSRLETCLTVWPKVELVRRLASRASRQAGDLVDADVQIREAQRLKRGTSDEIAFEWALLQATDGNVRDVEDYLQKHADSHPEDAGLVWEALTEGYLRNFRILDAMACVQHWLTGSPDNVRALELRGRTFVVGKGVKRGSDDYRRVLELDPSRDQTRLLFIRALLDLGGYGEAVPHLELLMKSRPDDTEAPVLLARCFNMLDRKAEARRLLEEVVAKHPDDALALRTLGQFALSEGQASAAEGYLRKAAAGLPNDYTANWFLYESLRQQGKPDAAAQLKVAEQVRDRSERIGELRSRKMAEQPLEPGLQVEMALLLMRSGQTETAVGWLQSALLLDPNFKPAHAALAEHYSKTGRADLAEQHRRLAAD